MIEHSSFGVPLGPVISLVFFFFSENINFVFTVSFFLKKSESVFKSVGIGPLWSQSGGVRSRWYQVESSVEKIFCHWESADQQKSRTTLSSGGGSTFRLRIISKSFQIAAFQSGSIRRMTLFIRFGCWCFAPLPCTVNLVYIIERCCKTKKRTNNPLRSVMDFF